MKKIKQTECKNFNGYKPCFPYSNCYNECERPTPRGKNILIVNLDAMGAVVQTTSILPAIKRKYPISTISWITLKNAKPILENNQYLDFVYEWLPENWLILQNMKWDVVYSIDKTKRSCAFAQSLKSKKILGFKIDGNGVILPINKKAKYFYDLGLNDKLKFKQNKKYGTEIVQEAMELKFKRDEYVLNLSEEENIFCESFKKINKINQKNFVVGFNTGCSLLFPNKKMTVTQHLSLINEISKIENCKIILLGGPEDAERNLEIFKKSKNKVINSPTSDGIRKGICYENLCDVIITGDSFGMHIAIGLKKYVIAWFGLSCESEIDLYGRGVKLFPAELECSPCWKKNCQFDLECIQMIDLNRIIEEIKNYKNKIGK